MVSKKIYIRIGDRQRIVVSAQAREILKWANVDEKKFVEKLQELFTECFTDTLREGDCVFSFENCYVSKHTMPWAEEMEVGCGKEPSIKIEIYEFSGTKKQFDTTVRKGLESKTHD